MILVSPAAAGSSRCSVRTTKSPASISSVNDSPGLISVSRIRIGSSPGGVMVNTVPTSNGPSTVIVSMPSFHCGQDAMSAQWRHSASGAALVSSPYSYSHIIPPCADDLSTDYISPPRDPVAWDTVTMPRSWDEAYSGDSPPPWDIGCPQPVFVRLADQGLLAGRVLDSGCGTGEHALLAAAHGAEATGIDASARAIALARTKPADRGLAARSETA